MKDGKTFGSQQQASMQVRTNTRCSLFTSVEIYRKCLASTYQGCGLQSLVSAKENREGGRQKKSSECVVFRFLPVVGVFSEHDSTEHVWAWVCRGVVSAAPPHYSALLATELTRTLKKRIPAPLAIVHTQIPTPYRFSLTCNSYRGIYVWEHTCAGQGSQESWGNWRRAAEQAAMSLFGLKYNDWRGGEGCVLDSEERWETSGSTFRNNPPHNFFLLPATAREEEGVEDKDDKEVFHCLSVRLAFPLTLGAGGTLPAFLADTGEGLSLHHAGTSIFTWVGQTTGVFCWRKTGREKCHRAVPNVKQF